MADNADPEFERILREADSGDEADLDFGSDDKVHYPAIFLSDIHLGTKDCQAELLLDFLKQHTCDRLYLVGDIIDGWRLKSSLYWPADAQRCTAPISNPCQARYESHLRHR